jgi:hypothetical protein
MQRTGLVSFVGFLDVSKMFQLPATLPAKPAMDRLIARFFDHDSPAVSVLRKLLRAFKTVSHTETICRHYTSAHFYAKRTAISKSTLEDVTEDLSNCPVRATLGGSFANVHYVAWLSILYS